MKCKTDGCSGRTHYGGHCPACEILFGSYMRLLQHYPEATFADEPHRPPDYVCGLHPHADVVWRSYEASWFCDRCGADIQDTVDDSTPTEEVPLIHADVTTSDT